YSRQQISPACFSIIIFIVAVTFAKKAFAAPQTLKKTPSVDAYCLPKGSTDPNNFFRQLLLKATLGQPALASPTWFHPNHDNAITP
ncbi:MAG: hypothetical protein VX332_11820, partial [Pseudomonadota bacterium]|nr:hypothetical protein [Pseudomonadota bacterium]